MTGFPFQPFDVLSHACADVCLFTRTPRFSMPASTARSQNRHLEAPFIAFRSGLRFADAVHHATTSTRIPVLSP
jgi:hypothetical protein